ncbi:MAG TPA: class I SAM-dependent methyltransferase [Candidatus Competibacter sp.]|nr:class I SAM-dependent methyltransferase [Candidatus Competibacter sp.]
MSLPASTPPCLGCGATALKALYRANAFDTDQQATFTLARCTQCDLVRTEPVLTEQQLGPYYAAPYYGDGQRKFTGIVERFTRFDNWRRARRLLALFRAAQPALAGQESRPWRILDIGCGRANLLAALARQGCECHGVERQEFPLEPAYSNIRFYRGKLEDLPLTAGYFDVIILWHVLEHVNNPALTLGTVEKLLQPGGILALAVPNFGSWQSVLFKSAWFHLDLPRHIHHFSRSALENLLGIHHLQSFKSSTWAFDQNVFGFVQSILNRLWPKNHANELYALLKKSKQSSANSRLLGWLTIACFIAPFALLEYLLSGLVKRGATLIIYAKKTNNPEY